VDGLSMLILFAEWERLTADPDVELPAIGITFRDYALQAQPDEESLDKALTYWRERTADLPPPPRLPLTKDPGEVEIPRFHRREARLDPEKWEAIKDRARRYGITPSVVLLACYAEVLSAWSGQPDLTVNLTLFDRRDVHPDIGHVVGDFTSVLLVAHRPAAHEGWLERARRLQEQVWRDLDHQEISGVRVLRELARENDRLAEPVPTVFTSMLGVDDALARTVRWPDHTRSQTPQVWLDHQVIELPDGLLLSWDSVDELFPGGLVDEMFAAYTESVERLADEPEWAAVPGKALPQGRPEPKQDKARPKRGFEAPVGVVEETVAGIWGDLLGVSRVGRHDGFFALGGDSLL
ncbi:non-ribosomal peptide synthetase, partial [Nonomuraea longispora]